MEIVIYTFILIDLAIKSKKYNFCQISCKGALYFWYKVNNFKKYKLSKFYPIDNSDANFCN